MLTDRQMDEALATVRRRMQRITDEYLRRMGEHIRDIGQLTPSDVHRLQQIRRMNRNLAGIRRQIMRAAQISAKELEDVFAAAAEMDSRVAEKITGVPDSAFRLKNNLPLRRALRAQAAETAATLTNLSNTTVAAGAYREAVDTAVTAIQSGVDDYGSAVRRVIRQAGSLGLRVRESGTRAVEYESGHTRRLDTAVAMNVLDAMRRMNQRATEAVGEEFGADGVEIDAHMLCAEDHLPYQGQQYSLEEFQQIQDSLDRPFGEWNCRHTWAPIRLGISPPAYTPEQLEAMERYSTDPVEIDGRVKTRYQWSQELRRCETAIRAQKDTATLARAAGDDVLRRDCQGSIVALNDRYRQLAEKAGLDPEFRRTYVAGFRDAKGADALTGAANSGTITMGAEPASLRFVVRTDQFGINASRILPIPGYEDIVIHGDRSGFEFRDNDGNVSPVNVHELAGMLRESPDYHGGAIRLVSCEAGAKGSTVAQTLADDLKVNVLAPSDVVWIAEDGSMTIGKKWGENSGRWVLFKPGKE